MDAASLLLVFAVAGTTLGSHPEPVAATSTAKRHAVFFAGQSGWGSEFSSPPPAAPPIGDRYAFGANGGGSSVSAPPSVVDRTRAAVVESSNALREGVEAGIQAANRQLYEGNEQVIETARSAGQELTNQFQGWAGTTLQQSGVATPSATGTLPAVTTGRSQVSNPFAKPAPAANSTPAAASRTRGGVSPPPWMGSDVQPIDTPMAIVASEPPAAKLNRAPVQTDSGWTSIRSSVPPPRLAVPQLINTPAATTPLALPTAGTAPLQPLAGQGGPNFPVTITQPADRSLLAPPPTGQTLQQRPAAATAADNWDFGWDGTAASQPKQATIGNRYETAVISAGSEAVRVNNPQLAAQSTASQSPPSFGIGAFDKNGWPENPAVQPAESVAQRDAIAGSPMAGSIGAPPAMGSMGAPGLPQNAVQVGPAPTLPSPNTDQVPWMPLVVVSLALAGSIGANLFLGWSYVDARQKYRTLVQKTANKFRRAVTV